MIAKLFSKIYTRVYRKKFYSTIVDKISVHPEHTKFSIGMRVRYHKVLGYKKIYPTNKTDNITGKNLLMFDVIWSDDLSLAPASLLGFPTNEYKKFKYRLLPKQLGEDYQYVYEIQTRNYKNNFQNKFGRLKKL